MSRFVQSEERTQETFLPCRLEDYVTEENPVRVIDVFVEQLDLDGLGFAGMQPEATGRPAYHPSTMLKIYLYGYLNHTPEPSDWKRLSAGEGTKGSRLHDWCYLELADLDADEFNEANHGLWTRGLLLRRNIEDGELAYFATWCQAGTVIETLVNVEGHRWGLITTKQVHGMAGIAMSPSS